MILSKGFKWIQNMQAQVKAGWLCVQVGLGTLSKKKTILFGKFFPNVGPPPPPPLLGTPYSKKKFYRLFCILGP